MDVEAATLADKTSRELGSLYQYSPLARNEIRLIQILPGADTDPVSIRIHHRSLDDELDYTALSYTWNDESTSNIVLVDGNPLAITPNLDAALRELRSRPVHFLPEDEPARSSVMFKRLEILMRNMPDTEAAVEFLQQATPLADELMEIFKSTMSPVHQDEARENRRSRLSSEVAKTWEKLEELCKTYARNESTTTIVYPEPKFLWADAISINQRDLKERNDQVQLMRRIYNEASSLIVWLGLEDASSLQAFSVLRAFEEGRLPNPRYDINQLLPSSAARAEAWTAISELFSRPWFHRTWTIQEYVLGSLCKPPAIRSVNFTTFCCGHDRLSRIIELGFLAIDENINQEKSAGSGTGFWIPKAFNLAAIHKLLQQYRLKIYSTHERPPSRYQFLTLLTRSKMALATDPRDKIYALLGLAEEMYDGCIQDLAISALIVDYRASVEDVFSSLVRAIVEATQRLDILGLCFQEKAGYIKRTWTPDWTVNLITGILAGEILRIGDTPDWFVFDATPGFDCIAVFAPDLSSLTVTGIVLEEIALTSSEFKDTAGDDQQQFKSDCRKMLSLSKEWRSCSVGRRLPQDTDFESLLLRTLTTTGREELERIDLHSNWKPFFQNWILPETVNPKAMTDLIELNRYKSEIIKHLYDILAPIRLVKKSVTSAFGSLSELSRDVTDQVDRVLLNGGIEEPSSVSFYLRTRSEDNDFGFKAALLRAMSDYPRIILTHNGYIGRSRRTVQKGDLVCLILGCATPMVLRPVGKNFEVVGEIYMEGMMHGEAMAIVEEEEMILQEFELR